MAEITDYVRYVPEGYTPKIPKPETPVLPMVVRARDGLPVRYRNCSGLGIRIVHPTNPKAPAKNMGLVLFCLPPHASLLPPNHHETEETYVVLRGGGVMTFANDKKVEVSAGDYIYLPPWCLHGVENTGDETLEILICTSPPNI